MDTIRPLNNISIRELQEYLASSQAPFETSQLYSAKHDAKFVDEDLRKSTFRAMTDPKLFSIMEKIVRRLSREDESLQFTLVRNDVTHIKYESGGFFKRHRDYLSTTSNLVQEFTLLICVTPHDLIQKSDGVTGGETTIFTYGGAGKTRPNEFDTTTPGCGLLFRKDLEHRGNIVKKGVKHIITANLWATKKQQSEQVLLVTFPRGNPSDFPEGVKTGSDDFGENDYDQIQVATKAIEQAASPATSYALPVDVLTGMLLTHVQWKNRQAEGRGQDHLNIITFLCRDFTHEAFGVVVKVLNRAYVDEHSIEKHQECLDYFGPFKAENLLVNLSAEDVDESHPQKKVKRSTSSREDSEIDSSSRGTGSETASTDTKLSVSSVSSNIIVCENEARMNAVVNVAKIFGEPYVPFNILFVEGVLDAVYEGGDGYVTIPMTPAACLLGDYNNIFSIWKACQKYTPENLIRFKKIQEDSNYWKMCPQSHKDKLAKRSPGSKVKNILLGVDDEDCKMDSCGFGLGLKWGFEHASPLKCIESIVLSGPFEFSPGKDSSFVLLPGLDPASSNEPKGGESDSPQASSISSSFFHRDANGKIAFSEEEADRTSDYIASIELDERVIDRLNEVRFDLPQSYGKIEEFFCNETVYGSLNLLWVCGAIRLPNGETSVGKQSTGAPDGVHRE